MSLSDAEQALIRQAMEECKKLPDTVPCTDCKYCKDCPQGIEIYQLFAGYNEKIETGASWLIENYHTMVPKGKQVTDCIECGACEAACPQGIEIMKEMKRIYAGL